jgi:hypothetical protein
MSATRRIRIALIALIASTAVITIVALARGGPERPQLLETKLGLAPLQADPRVPNAIDYASIFSSPSASADAYSGVTDTPPSDADAANFKPLVRVRNEKILILFHLRE